MSTAWNRIRHYVTQRQMREKPSDIWFVVSPNCRMWPRLVATWRHVQKLVLGYLEMKIWLVLKSTSGLRL